MHYEKHHNTTLFSMLHLQIISKTGVKLSHLITGSLPCCVHHSVTARINLVRDVWRHGRKMAIVRSLIGGGNRKIFVESFTGRRRQRRTSAEGMSPTNSLCRRKSAARVSAACVSCPALWLLSRRGEAAYGTTRRTALYGCRTPLRSVCEEQLALFSSRPRGNELPLGEKISHLDAPFHP